MSGVPWGTSENYTAVTASSPTGKKSSGARAAQSSVPGIIYGGSGYGPADSLDDGYAPKKKSPYAPAANGCPFATSNEPGQQQQMIQNMPPPNMDERGVGERMRVVRDRKQVGAAKVGTSAQDNNMEHRENFFNARESSQAARNRNRGSGNILAFSSAEE